MDKYYTKRIKKQYFTKSIIFFRTIEDFLKKVPNFLRAIWGGLLGGRL